MKAQFPVFFSEQERPYTGRELRPHFLLTELGLRGSALAAFAGPCDVRTEHLVDWEDRLAQDRIEARRMVHFLGEFFGASLREGVLRQRLLMAQIAQALVRRLEGRTDLRLYREGDDLYVESRGDRRRKLSVSIVTASPVSQLLHVGINLDPTGAPVPAIGLAELGIARDAAEARAWAIEILEGFAAEWDSVEWACAKVRPMV